jgi:hypothetical protein
MKKVFPTIISIILVIVILAGCTNKASVAPEAPDESVDQGNEPEVSQDLPESALTGSTEDILMLLLDEDTTYFIDPITSENAPGMLGVNPDDFVSFIEEATTAMNILGMIAFQVSVVKCKDINDVEIVAEMIQTGFDSSKWIEVMPERSLTTTSGLYILLAVGTEEETDSLVKAFKDAAGGTASEPVVFYTGEFGVNVDGEFGIEPLPADLGSEG